MSYSASENTSGADPGNGSADNERYRTSCCTTDDGSNFKRNDAGEKNAFDRVHGVELAEEQLEGAAS